MTQRITKTSFVMIALTQDRLRNVCITDATTGNILFERVYKSEQSFTNLSSLIQVFYQFAREVDDGVISCINFESNVKGNTRRKKPDLTLSASSQTMQMLSVKTREFIVSIFYDMRGQLQLPVDERFRMDIFLNSLKDEFEKKYYTDHLANFTSMNQKPPKPPITKPEQCSDFIAVADHLRDKLLGDAAPPPPVLLA